MISKRVGALLGSEKEENPRPLTNFDLIVSMDGNSSDVQFPTLIDEPRVRFPGLREFRDFPFHELLNKR